MSPLGGGRGGRRRGWYRLSEGQRRRYVRAAAKRGWAEADIRQYYTAGGDMAAFRGHGTTPERPGRAARQPERYGDYRRRRTRYLRVVTTGGVKVLPVWNPADRHTIGSHWNAITHYVVTGDASRLDAFAAVKVGDGDTLSTDQDDLARWWFLPEFDFDDIYLDRT